MSIICKLKNAVEALQEQVDAIINTDDQQLSLTGNLLTLEDGGTVDLTPFLNIDTDDQEITAFSLAGTVLTLTIEDGNTVTVDLASLDTDTDDQTLALAGNILSIADGNSINLSSFEETLTTTTRSFCEPVAWVNVNADGTIAAECGGVTASRTGLGTYTLTPPPEAETVQLTVLEDLATRDSIEIHPVDFLGSTVHIGEGDNGASANTLRDRGFTAVWYGPEITVIETAVLA